MFPADAKHLVEGLVRFSLRIAAMAVGHSLKRPLCDRQRRLSLKPPGLLVRCAHNWRFLLGVAAKGARGILAPHVENRDTTICGQVGRIVVEQAYDKTAKAIDLVCCDVKNNIMLLRLCVRARSDGAKKLRDAFVHDRRFLSAVGEFEQHFGVARLVERAPTREVFAAQIISQHTAR